jgi:hypothetical protein
MNAGSEEQKLLADAVDGALTAYRNKTRAQSLITRDAPDEGVLAPVMAAIEGCEDYQAVVGQSLFAIGTVEPIEARQLAQLTLSRAEWKSPSDAVDWLLDVLRTKTATVILKAAIWGISIDVDIRLSESSCLMQFDKLPPSYGKGLIADRKKWQQSPFVWYSDRHFDVPLTAYTVEIVDVPFISDFDFAFAFAQMDEATRSAIEVCRMIEGVCVGHPLPLAYWLEFQDSELNVVSNANFMAWSLPEVYPQIKNVTQLSSNIIAEHYVSFCKLAHDWKADLRRSMDRYTLSQCRHALIDRVLDLALAFEIAVSQKGDNLPVRWKVSVRAAQLIGGTMEERKSVRRAVGQLYELRNKATHGSTLAGAEWEVVFQCTKIYQSLLRRLFEFAHRPDWNSIELESPSRS